MLTSAQGVLGFFRAFAPLVLRFLFGVGLVFFFGVAAAFLFAATFVFSASTTLHTVDVPFAMIMASPDAAMRCLARLIAASTLAFVSAYVVGRMWFVLD